MVGLRYITGPKMIVKDWDKYVYLRGTIGKAWVLWEGFASKCPYCGKLVFQKGFVKQRKKPGLYKHLKMNCHEAPWYWPVHAYFFKRKYNLQKYNWDICTSVRKIIKAYIGDYKNLREFSKSLDKS